MALSSNSLLHFTKKIESLVGILENGFKIHYCYEAFRIMDREQPGEEIRIDLLVPVVSFCDIPFSQIAHISNAYGDYGIGLKKDWAREKGLNPVLYIEQHSMFANNLPSLIEIIAQINPSEKNIVALDLLRYTKNYQGKLTRSDRKEEENYRFSDEREWRFVPEIISTKWEPLHNLRRMGLDPNPDVIRAKKNLLNKKLETEHLTFLIEDINYIIVKSEPERPIISTMIDKLVDKIFTDDEAAVLKTKILTMEQIRNDF